MGQKLLELEQALNDARTLFFASVHGNWEPAQVEVLQQDYIKASDDYHALWLEGISTRRYGRLYQDG